MRVLNLRVRHILGLKELDLDMGGNNLILVGGKNGQGKSSLLRALLMALCGKRGMEWPAKAIHDGEDEGEVVVTLSGDDSFGEDRELKVHLEIKQKRSGEIDKITIYDSAGEPSPNPRTLLSDLYHTRAFDPLAFERMKPTEQRDMIARLVGIDLDADRKLYADKFEERKVVNRDVVRLEGALKSMPVHEDAPDAQIDTLELMSQLDTLRKENLRIEAQQARVVEVANRQQEAISRITRLEEQLAVAKETYEKATRDCGEAKKALDEMGEPKDDKSIMDKIGNASELNKKHTDNQAAAKTKADLDSVKAQSDALTDELEQIKKDAEAKLSAVAFPVPGMSLDKEGVLLNGRAFSDNSRAERIKASALVGIALNPTLKLMVCEDGSDLDEESLEALDQILREGGFQAIVELVTRGKDDEDRCAVIIEAGEAK